MEIKQNGTMIEVDGIIKTINDSQVLVDAIKNASRSGSVIIKIMRVSQSLQQ